VHVVRVRHVYRVFEVVDSLRVVEEQRRDVVPLRQPSHGVDADAGEDNRRVLVHANLTRAHLFSRLREAAGPLKEHLRSPAYNRRRLGLAILIETSLVFGPDVLVDPRPHGNVYEILRRRTLKPSVKVLVHLSQTLRPRCFCSA
jgi:hypothetical protein